VGTHKPTDIEIVKQSLDQLALYKACGQLVESDSSFLKNDNYVTEAQFVSRFEKRAHFAQDAKI